MRKVKRIIALLCVTVMLAGNCCMQAFAEELENSKIIELEAVVSDYVPDLEGLMPYSFTFVDTSIYISYDTSGMHITIHTGVNNTASVVGVKDITVQVKSGNNWVTVATSNGGEVYDISGCSISITYPYSVKNKTYRVCCTHYATVDSARELYHEADGVLCTVTSTAP